MTKQSSDLANVEKPTRDGYKFLGWAATKDATEATAGILDNVTESKTVYAVWEQKDANKLTLVEPTEKVPVSDKTDLTAKEKEAVKQAVIDANTKLGLTKDDITVASDGKVTVTKDGKTGELTPEQTVKQKEVINNINPPEEPIEVKNKEALTEEEKGKVRDAIIKANPDLNLKPEEVEVDEKGNVTIEQGGKKGTVPAEKTVVEESKIIKLNKPTPVEVKDVNNLTPTEKKAVEDAVREANKTKLSNDAQITVDANGNVTVTDGGKTGTLEGKDTVKPFDRTGKTLNDPKEKVEVSDLNKLTEAEKEAVREAVKAANPDLNFKNEEIEVANDGTVKVPMGTNPDGTTKYETIDKSKTVKQDDTTKTISLTAPKVTPVVNPTSLTDDEKAAVKKAVEDANKDGSGNSTLPTNAVITVADDGSVTVTSGNKIGMLSQADTVVKKLDPPEVASDEAGNIKVRPTDDRTSETEVTYTGPDGATKTVKAIKGSDGKWKIDTAVEGVKVDENTGVISIPSNKIKNGSDVKAVAKDGDNTSDGKTTTSNDNKAPANPEIAEDANGNVTITPPTDKDTKTVTVSYTDKDGNPKTVTATKDGDKWKIEPAVEGVTVDENTGVITVSADKIKPGAKVSAQAEDGNGNKSSDVGITTKTQADKFDPKVPAKTKVDNATGLTQTEKDTVKAAIENENKDGSGNSTLPEGTEITIGEDGTATIKYKDGSEDIIKGTNLVEQKTDAEKTEPTVPSKTKVGDTTKLSEVEKEAIQKAIEDANRDKFPEGTKVEVADDGTATITYPDGSTDTIPGTDLVEQKSEAEKTIADNTEPKVPTDKVKVEDANNLNNEEKGKVKEAVENANKDGSNNSTLPENTDVTIGNDGSATITYPDNSKDKIKGSDLVEEKPKITEGKAENDPNKTTTTVSGKTKPNTEVTITLPNGTEIKVTSDSEGNFTKEVDKQNSGATIKVTPKDGTTKEITVADKGSTSTLADQYTPAYTEADAIAGKPSTITAPNFTDKDGKDATKPEDTTFELGTGAPTGAEINSNTGEVKYTPTDADAGKTVTIPVVVKYNDGSTDKVNVTVQVAPKAGTEVKAPATPVKVDNSKALTDEEKAAVKKAVEDANKDGNGNSTLPEGATIDVADDGTVTVKDKNGKVLGTISANETVKQDDRKLAVKAPTPVEVKDPNNVSEEEQGKIKEAIKNANPDLNLTDDDITVDNKGNVTIKKGNKTQELTPAQTVTKATDVKAPTTPVKVDNSKALTDDEKAKVKQAVEDANKDGNGNSTLPEGATIDVADDGTVTVKDKTGKTIATIPANKTVEQDDTKLPVKAPTPVEVNDPNHLTPAEKAAVEDAVRRANAPDLDNATITVADDGTVTVTIGNKRTVLPRSKTVTRKTGRPDASDYNEGRIIFWGINPFRRAEEPKKEKEVKETFTHKAYISGYPDGTVRPMGNITRAEAATMIARLLEIEDTASPAKPTFTDTPSEWYNKYINAAVEKGLMKGYPEGTFKPNAPITRAEFTYMISIIDKKDKGAVPFADVKGHWAEDAIGREFAAGRIAGYPDGSFRPDANITRAEAAKILNRVFERSYDDKSTEKSEDTVRIKMFQDLPTDFWGYDDMIEATNTHVLTRRVKGQVAEDWSDINR